MSDVIYKLYCKNRLGVAGYVPSGGRPKVVYGGWKVPEQILEKHELPLTDFCESLGWPRCRRGYNVDSEKKPDLELFLPQAEEDGQVFVNRYLVELHTGSMKRAQVRKRWLRYAGDFTALIITRDNDRLQDLIEWSDRLGDSAYFTTLDEVLSEPFGKVWRDFNGDFYAIDKPVEKSIEQHVAKSTTVGGNDI